MGTISSENDMHKSYFSFIIMQENYEKNYVQLNTFLQRKITNLFYSKLIFV